VKKEGETSSRGTQEIGADARTSSHERVELTVSEERIIDLRQSLIDVAREIVSSVQEDRGRAAERRKLVFAARQLMAVLGEWGDEEEAEQGPEAVPKFPGRGRGPVRRIRPRRFGPRMGPPMPPPWMRRPAIGRFPMPRRWMRSPRMGPSLVD
jgi:hypothetical protein